MNTTTTSIPILAEQVAERARASLSNYCINECKSLCCRKGYLTLPENEAKRVSVKLTPNAYGDFVVDLSEGCPKLKDNKCSIYAERPQACRNFPVYVRYHTVQLAESCPAVRENKLFAFEAELIQLGVRILRT